VSAFDHAIAGDQNFIARPWEKGSCIVANPNGYPFGANTLLIKEAADSPDKAELADIAYSVRHTAHPPA
jgi:hypothetical protein